ncbi:MAG: Gfo/Idh/MocA family oxidoreductase [Pseudomonadota bacterium]
MTRARLRLAAVGTGYFSQFHYEAWRRLDVELVGLCSLDRQGAEAVARTFGLADVITDFAAMLDQVRPDLVDIITPPHTHMAFIKAAAERGVPMVCQKPFTPCLADAEAAVAIAEAAGVPLIVHENFRFMPWYSEIRRCLEAGEIGDPYQVSFRLRPGDGQGPEAYLARQPYFQKMERFLVHETAIHLIDVFRFLFGEVIGVTARLAQLNPAIAGEDAGLILFDFANGARGLFDGNRLADHAAENRRLTMGEMLVEGSKGAIRLNGDGVLFRRRHGENQEWAIDYDWNDRGFGGDCVYRLQKHVLACLEQGGEVMNQGQDYLANLHVEEAVYRSNQTGERVLIGADRVHCD